MSGDEDSGGGAHVQIGSITGGSQAFGAHGKAESTNHTVVVSDPKQQELLGRVRALRGELSRADELTAADEALDAELGEVEREIGRVGHGGSGLLGRLRTRLEQYGAAAATAASVTAVLQAIAQITG
ncbi:hypothetical protein GCM10010277_60110 [Streptomyces longisporoflavus]|uniref:hypothetical protein n=1 Tax=Streptomyces longisporoflavus TaxID=28044 RepID=UPI00167C5DD8|nr:hypothetical protein [Streptomyces longisporoflavus]GGV57824.1 hypothetical protein GCM10010277_60110 [Streptomyces longisporoflavus]